MAEKDWQDRLRDTLGDYGERVPDSLWEAVDASVSQTWRKRRLRRRSVWGGICGVCVAAAVATTFVAAPGPQPGAGPAAPAPLLAESPAPVRPTESPVPAAPDAKDGRAAAEPAGVAAKPARGTVAPQPAPLPVENPAPTRPAENPAPAVPDTKDGRAAAEPATPAAEPERAADPQPFGFPEPELRRKTARRGAELRLALSNTGGSRSGSAGYGAMFGSEVVSLLDAPATGRTDSYSAVLLENNFREVSTSTRHYQPLRLALTAAWPLGRRLALESGLSYACLVSDLRSGTADNRYDTRQTLHYAGIPLKLNWQLWSLSRFELYLSGGVAVQKCVAGKSVTSYYVGSSRIDSGTERVVDEPLRWSAGLSAGLSYDLGGRFRLFAEPGLGLYFGNGSFVQTLYGDRPLNFEFSAGLRYALGR